ncbi:MAG: bifunctional (p)ppGpp synthetase/guanosine-3',5'-bis(diphosphate) 3'-pyrophosphohydrolase [Rhodospirillales bacterium]|nr:bifunctional (p)ppGpp synthetase/guanosine-3',5'-bis(diphosphate) 3'-pyrophosphohydrolase [Alphaproteobacteria bacterium]MCB9986860.1 bifunctional (p)ppGpp synthetase/guanosine-3',5'-bis(diphosphate) 3'-pyrophosphohydrolase [Rhodospirillales bacterium]USO08379.1 MAG: bifunctional (p)ppGpp synthetase/guanosine-3',5'-bis(diphosphate) 3'-pyrophosphohydrolase [Rhodospirillales bacterium]
MLQVTPPTGPAATKQPAAHDPGPALLERARAYLPAEDVDRIARAIDFAREKHEGQTRSSGEPYYTHPVEVAIILADMRLDTATILTAILHDTVEDTDATLDDLKRDFGPEVAQLVDGVSKLTKIESKTVEGKQAENFRKLVLAMSEDIRVLLVKLADRLHNMRTLHHVPKIDKRQRIAAETLEIYAPLAERIGVHAIKEELEDLSFGHLKPEARESITARLSFLRSEGSDVVNDIITGLDKILKEAGIAAEITGREKTRYSIWKKMQRKNVAFEQLSDIMAFRVVVDSLAECYHVLGVIHSAFPTVPGRFKDYISTPKPNGYKSIHTTVLGPHNQRIEIQIRTRDMHSEADLGVAAHWAYKNGRPPTPEDLKKFRWLRDLLDIIDADKKPEEFLENTKLALFQDMVYCFTPKGDLIELPNGATPIDFAYAIHSNVGDRTVSAKINGRIVPLNTKLTNGDQVDIQTQKNQTPSPTWERFAVTGKAKSHIRRFIRQQQRDQYVQLGRAMLQKVFKQEGYDYTDKAVQPAVGQYKSENVDDIFAGIGQGNIVARDIFKILFPSHRSEPAQAKAKIPGPSGTFDRARKGDSALPIKGLIPGMAVHYARCCHPLPGDRIVGIVTTGKGVTVHTIDCETLETFADTPERWLDVQWTDESDKPENHVGRLNITITNTQGSLATLSTVISKNGGNITNLKITNRSLDFWDMFVDVSVADTRHLNDVIAALRATSCVMSVERTRGR